MKNIIQRVWLILVVSLVLVFFTEECIANQCNSIEECNFIYEQAIIDAAIYEPSEREELSPILDDQVTAVTWTDWSGYEVGTNTLGQDIWVTVAPQMQEKCRTFAENGEDLNLRLEQLLGLPPDNGKTKVVEIEVDADNLFRPCANPDISKIECSSTFPEKLDSSHIKWFMKNVLNSYQVPSGYPWTRLGYTYDWNPNSPELGLSEYIVRKGSTVTVTSIRSTSDYCTP